MVGVGVGGGVIVDVTVGVNEGEVVPEKLNDVV